MSHDDETTPGWETELSFERKAESAWEQELSMWDSADAAPAGQPPTAEASAPVDTPTAPAPAPSLDHSWLTQPLEEVSEPVAAPAVEPVLAPEPEPEVVAPVIELPAPAPPPFEAPEAPSAPPAAAVLSTVAPTEIESELESEETQEAVAKVPFYRREISLKRAPSSKKTGNEKTSDKPKRERKPKRDRAPKAERPPDEVPDAVAKVPFYKRDLSFKRANTKDERPERAPKERKKRERPKLRLPSLPKPELGGGSGKNAVKLVGLKIGASQIAAARVTNGDSPQLLQAVSAPLEHGVVVGGELRDPEALAVALREFFKRHNLPRKGIRLGIANNRIGVRTLDIVGIEDPKQLDNAVRFRAQEVLPIPIEDAVLDYQVLSESVDADGQPSRRVLLVVAYRDLVDRYVEACRNAGLEIVGIDLEAFAMLRALAEPSSSLQPLPGVERGALVAVSIGHDRSTFAISDGRVCEFTRVLEWGGWSLNVAIARALDTTPSEVEAVKRAISFAGDDREPPQGFGTDQLATAREAARGQLQSFARELVSSLQFYQGQPGSLSIGEIVITGGTSHLAGFNEELERIIGVPVRIGDPLSRVTPAKGVGELEGVGSLAVAIGLGIDD